MGARLVVGCPEGVVEDGSNAMAKHEADRSEEPRPGGIVSVRDPIRIVPLHVEDELLRPLDAAATAAAAAAHLSYRGGPLLSAVKVFTVYWGTAWEAAPLAGTATKLDEFFGYVLTSPLIDQLAEYSVSGHSIGHGSWTGRAVVTTPAPKHVVTDAAIQHMLQHELNTNNAFPVADRNTLYFVYLPPGHSVVQGGARSCQAFCGYHSDIAGQIFYAAMPYPGCAGCSGGLDPFDALASTSSHGLCEAITDPIPGQGWYDDANGEIGDICAWKTRKLGHYTVQLEWSNKHKKCM
jgi:hypothetical protein